MEKILLEPRPLKKWVGTKELTKQLCADFGWFADCFTLFVFSSFKIKEPFNMWCDGDVILQLSQPD